MKIRLSPLALFLCAGSIAASAFAQQTFSTWTGTVNGNWNVIGNWNNLLIPDVPGDVAIIPGGSAAVLNIPVTLDKIGIGPGATVSQNNNLSMTILAQTDGLGVTGLMSCEGTYAMNSVGNSTDLRFQGPAGSSVVFGNVNNTVSHLICSNSLANRIYGVNGVEKLFLEQEVTLEGSVQLGINQLEIENFGTIRATTPAGLVIDPNGAGMTNHGIIEAGTANLTLTSGTFRNAGGGIVANANQSVFIDSSRVEGGQFDTAVSGSIYLRGSSIVDTRLNGMCRIPNNNNGHIETALTLVNPGSTLSLDSVGNTTDCIIDNDVTIHGVSFNAGITSSNSQANRIYSSTGSRLTLADTAYIRGSMQLGVNLMSLTINPFCAVEALGSADMTIDPNSGGVLNQGTLRAKAGATLTLSSGGFDNTAGIIDAESGGVVAISSSTVTGGQLTGAGFMNATGSALVGVTNSTDLRVPNNNNSTLLTSLTNNTTLTLNSVGNTTDLKMHGPVIISGPGTIFATNTQANRFYSDNGSRLTNALGHTIRGSMQLGINQTSFANNGIVEAAGSSGMTIDADANGFDNNNIVRAATGSSLLISGTSFDNTGATIHAQDASSITFSGSTITGGTLTSAGTGFINTTTSELNAVTNSADLRVPNNNNSVLRNTLVNNSTLTMNSVGNTTDLRIVDNVTVSGPGSIFATNTQANRMYSDNGSRLTNALGHTIRGSMQLGANSMSITNNGVIESVGSADMTIDANGDGFDNNNLVRATTGSSLAVVGTTFDNTGATVHAQDGASVTLNSSTITGGSLTTAGTGFINVVGSLLDNVTNYGDLRLPNNNNSIIRHALFNNGTFSMNSVGNTTDLRILDDTIFSGNGVLAITNTQANRIYSDNGSRLTNASGHTIRGSVQLGANSMSMTNEGSILAVGSGAMTIDMNGNGFDNRGLLQAVSGNITIADSPFTTSGTVIVDAGRLINRTVGNFIQTAGNVIANGELQVVSNDYQLQGGTMSGIGLFDTNIVNSGGTMAPGAPTGILTVQGTYTQQSGGTFDFEVGSVSDPNLNDTLNITGTGSSATLAGTIRIHRSPGFVPPIGQGFTIVGTAANQRFGQFATIVSNDFWHIVYLNNAAVAVFDGLGTPDCPPDFNDDGVLDFFDYLDFIDAFANNFASADYNHDTVIDFFDYLDFVNDFAAGC